MNVTYELIKTSVSNKNKSYPELFYPLLCISGISLKTHCWAKGEHRLFNRQNPKLESLVTLVPP